MFFLLFLFFIKDFDILSPSNNDDMGLIKCIHWLEALYNLIKEKYRMHNYLHKEKESIAHINK